MRKSAVSHPEAMEARSVGEIPRGDEWQYEPKWDGFRCLLSRNDSGGDLTDILDQRRGDYCIG